MADIVEFVLARVAEREADAECWHHWLDCDYAQVAFYGPSSSCECNGKAWVLADCEAKRRIIERWQETGPPYADARQQEIHETLGEEVIPLFASVDADHPDFDETWRA